MNEFKNFISMVLNLNGAFTSQDRYQELLKIIRDVVPYDMAMLMILENDELIPVASYGLAAEASTKVYPLKMYPRLDLICRSQTPILFPSDYDLPEPFEGMAADPFNKKQIKTCLGCPLIVEDKVVGVLAADAFLPNAFDHISKDFCNALAALTGATLRTAKLLETLELTLKRENVVRKELMNQVAAKGGGELIGTAPIILHLKEEMKMVAKSDLAVLIMGETGTGKELVARGIHANSPRFDKPLIYVNCAALPEGIAESELFGHKKGSFTGATQDRMGKFEVANHGTLFLDEIGELPPSIQGKLLRVIQEGEIQRVGEDRVIKVDVRIIAATNRNLEEDTRSGPFRLDLFHRLNAYPLKTPALRDHIEDIPLLVNSFFDYYQRRLGSKPFVLSEKALLILEKYPWPGNVRELRNMISRITLLASQEPNMASVILIEPRHLILPTDKSVDSAMTLKSATVTTGNESEQLTLKEALLNFKKQYIFQTVKKHDGNWAKAAQDLGLHRSNLYHLRDQLKLNK